MNEALEQEFDFYRGAGRGEVLDQLTHLAAWARSLVMLTGPDGAGKTLLLEQVVARVVETGRSIIVRPPVGFLSTGHELLRHVAADLGVRVADGLDEAGLQRVAMQHIVAELANDRSTLLLLDDAHELSADVLRAVARLVDEAKDSRGLNVLLAGGPSLPEQLRKATPARENWHEIRLRPFALNDMRAFLRQRLPQSAAGLDAAGLNALARKTGGWPGRVLAAFDGQPRKRRFFPRRVPLLHVGLLLALITALGVVVWFQRAQRAPAPAAVKDGQQTEVETLVLPETRQRVVVAANGSGVRMTLPAEAPADPRLLLPPSQRIPVPKPPAELSMPAPPAAPMLKLPGAAAPVAAGTRPTVLPAGGAQAGAPAAGARLLPPPPPPEPSQEPASAAPVATGAPTAAPAVERTGGLSAATSAAAAVSATTPPAASAARSNTGNGGDSAWLNAQPPANFTVQVMGVSAASAAQNYLRRHPNAGLRIIRTVRDGRDWYVVVKGSYQGRGEAQGAIKELNDGNARPWVRTIDGIQRDTRGP